MTLRLVHLNLPARDPEGLARWYAAELGLERRGAFLLGPAGTLIAFERGAPIGPRGNTHFGFAADSAAAVRHWAAHFDAAPEGDEPAGYVAVKVRDPEGNCFEIYWEPAGPPPPVD